MTKQLLGVVYVVPFDSGHNPYSSLLRSELKECGYEPLKFSFFEVVKQRLKANNQTIILNWIENSLVEKPFSLTLTKTFMVLLGLFNVKSLFVIHNHFPHKLRSVRSKHKARKIIECMNSRSNLSVCHGLKSAHFYGAEFLAHPPFRAPNLPVEMSKKDFFLIFGRIERYKKIEDIIKIWPDDVQLLVVGKGDAGYISFLRSLVSSTQKAVIIQADELTEEQLDERIQSSRGVVVPGHGASAIVSGNIFKAISCGTPAYLSDNQMLSEVDNSLYGIRKLSVCELYQEAGLKRSDQIAENYRQYYQRYSFVDALRNIGSN